MKTVEPTTIALTLVVLGLLFWFAPEMTGTRTAPVSTGPNVNAQAQERERRERVNKYLQEMDRDQEFRKLSVKLENAKLAPPVQGNVTRNLNDMQLKPGLDLSQEQTSILKQKDIRKPSKQPNYQVNLDDATNAEIIEAARQTEYDKIYREEFVQQFVRNAASAGVIVHVDKNMNVEVLQQNNARDNRTPQSVGSK